MTYGHARALRVVGNPWDEEMCSSTTNAIGAGNTNFVECFEAAQSFGFYNFEAFFMVQSQKMTSGTMKGNKFSFTSVRFQACSEITLGREDQHCSM